MPNSIEMLSSLKLLCVVLKRLPCSSIRITVDFTGITHKHNPIRIILLAFTVVAASPKLHIIKEAPFLTYFPYFEEIKVGLCDHRAVCVSPL
jgi:hypothetical protein